MKQTFISAALFIGLLMAGKNASAQNNAARAVKIASDDNVQKPSAEPEKTAKLKQDESKPPVMPALQKAPATQQVAATTADADISQDVKAVEIKADTQKEKKSQNADRPKTSTIEPAKKLNLLQSL